jgi:hypothetical protein
MEILVFILLGFVLGICLGNTSIRNKIGEEIHTIITQERPQRKKVDCPIKETKYKAAYVPKKEQTSGGCNKCGGHVEPIDKMPGYFFCTACNSITSKSKETAK